MRDSLCRNCKDIYDGDNKMNLQVMFRDMVDGATVTFSISVRLVELLEKWGLKLYG